MPTPANNSVRVHPDGYIEIMVVGDQDYMSIDEVSQQANRLIKDLRVHKKKILGLIDVTGETSTNSGSHKAALEALETITYDKVAFIVNKSPLTDALSMVIAALGKDAQTQMFATRNVAVAWLLSSPGESIFYKSETA